MKPEVTILGAGFAGMELATRLSEEFADDIAVTLINDSDAFVFGYSKLDVMFGRNALEAVRLPYRRFQKPGVRFVQETVTAIDPHTRRVTTSAASYDADFLVVALGADYDFAATPGLRAGQDEFYSVEGACNLRERLPAFARGDCEIEIVSPLPSPVPPSPETSQALLTAFAERGIRFSPGHKVASLDRARGVAVLDNGKELGYELFLGIPKHRAPAVVEAAGMVQDGFVPVDPRLLETKFADVWAVGDIAATGVPKAGLFAEAAAAAVAKTLIARIRGVGEPGRNPGAGTCYLEFDGGRIGKVEVDFLSGPKATGTYHAPSESRYRPFFPALAGQSNTPG